MMTHNCIPSPTPLLVWAWNPLLWRTVVLLQLGEQSCSCHLEKRGSHPSPRLGNPEASGSREKVLIREARHGMLPVTCSRVVSYAVLWALCLVLVSLMLLLTAGSNPSQQSLLTRLLSPPESPCQEGYGFRYAHT